MTSTHLQQFAPDFNHWLASVPTSEHRTRQDAFALAMEQGLPTTRHEDWRYTSLRSFWDAGVSLVPAAAAQDFAKSAAAANLLAAHKIPGAHVLLFVDGEFITGDHRTAATTATSLNKEHDTTGKTFALLREAMQQQHILTLSGHPRWQIISLLSPAAAQRSVHTSLRIHIPAGESIDLTDTVLSAEPESQTLLNRGLSFSLGTGSTLNLLQTSPKPPRFFIDDVNVDVAADAHFHNLHLTQGESINRHELTVHLLEKNSAATLNAFTTTSGKQNADHFTRVFHHAPETSARQLYKGVAAGHSRLSARAMIQMKPGCQAANAKQTLRYLLEGEHAEVDARPELGIWHDDVKCSHGASIARLNDDEVFYLRSRAIGLAEAKLLLLHGFAQEVLQTLPSPTLAQEASRLMKQQIEGCLL